MMSMGDVMRYVPGVTGASGREQPRSDHHPRQQLVGRLLRRRRARRRAVLPRPLQLDRVEVLKGPNALIFGRGGAGGVVNRVGKEAGVPAALRGVAAGRDVRQQARHDRPRSPARRHRGVPPQRHVRGLRQLPRPRRPEALRHHADADVHCRAAARRSSPATNTSTTPRRRSRHHVVPGQAGRRRSVHLFRQSRATATCDADVNLGIRHRRTSGRRAAPSATTRSLARYDRSYQNYVPGAVSANQTQFAMTAYNNATDRTNLFNQTDLTYLASTGRDPPHAAGRRRDRPSADRQFPQHRLLQQHRDVDPRAARRADDHDAGDLPPERDRRRQSSHHRPWRRLRAGPGRAQRRICRSSAACASIAST